MNQQPPLNAANLPPEVRRKLAKTAAVSSAMNEVLNEQRAEIIRRSRIKLKELGFEFSDEELTQP